jgi:TolB-like protein
MTDLTDPSSFLNTGLAGRYQIERELGRGGMATVYLARDLRQDRFVALKVLHPELAHALGPERFLREIRLTARLQHPHILPVFDSGDTRSSGSEGLGQLWYTMPYVAGESLRARLAREKHLPVDDAVQLVIQVLAALDYAHGEGLVHRDIKPENILLQGDQAVVADFGLARSISRAGGEKLTETGITMGTPAYMSPEQAAGEGELDGRSDLYSLGCVLYELLAGQPPFTGRSAQQILARHAVDPVPSLRTVRRTVPQSVEQAITRALAKIPADRFATAAAFSLALTAPAGADLREWRSVRVRSILGTRPWLRRGVLSAIVLIGAAAAGVLFSRGRSPPALNPNLVAVAPFDVLDPKFELWREGLVDYLTKNLEGAGQLHTVAPVVVLQRWQGHADAGSARALGNRTRARVVVFGNLAPAGRDSVRVRATVLDAASGASVAEFEGLDQLDRVDRLADSLTVQVLRGLGRTTTGGPARLTTLGTRSIPAIKAYLQGEQYFRHAQYDSADASFSRAIELDSTFALALLRLGDTRGWSGGNAPELHLRAARFNHGLSPRDSLVITVDSLRAAAGSGQDSAVTSHRVRMVELLDQLVALSPNDPEVLLLRADLQFHQEGYAGGPVGGQRGVRQGFDAAIALDSTFAPAYIHPIELAGDAAHARPYVAGYLRAVAPDRRSDWVGLLAKLVQMSGKDVGRFLDSVPTHELGDVLDHISTWHDGAEIAVQLGRVYYLRSDNPEAGSGRPESRLARLLAYRGHLREARATLGNRFGALLVDLARLGTVPADTASAIAAAWFRNPNPLTFGGTFPVYPATTDPVRPRKDPPVSAALWWASQRDTSSLLALSAAVRAAAKRPEAELGVASAPGISDLTRAALALARVDTAEALRQLLALPDSVFFDDWRVRLLRFQLLAASQEDSRAAEVFNEQILPPLSPVWVLGVLKLGRMTERDGARNLAAEYYRFVRDVWLHADPELQMYVSEARNGHERVGGNSPRETAPSQSSR